MWPVRNWELAEYIWGEFIQRYLSGPCMNISNVIKWIVIDINVKKDMLNCNTYRGFAECLILLSWDGQSCANDRINPLTCH